MAACANARRCGIGCAGSRSPSCAWIAKTAASACWRPWRTARTRCGDILFDRLVRDAHVLAFDEARAEQPEISLAQHPFSRCVAHPVVDDAQRGVRIARHRDGRSQPDRVHAGPGGKPGEGVERRARHRPASDWSSRSRGRRGRAASRRIEARGRGRGPRLRRRARCRQHPAGARWCASRRGRDPSRDCSRVRPRRIPARADPRSRAARPRWPSPPAYSRPRRRGRRARRSRSRGSRRTRRRREGAAAIAANPLVGFGQRGEAPRVDHVAGQRETQPARGPSLDHGTRD